MAKPSIFSSRRQFLFTGIASVVAAWAGTLVQSILFPPVSAGQATPVEIPLAELPVGGTKQIAYAGAPALVMRSQDGVRALSMVCTHAGCTVQWRAASRQFYCACHDGKFDEFGDVAGGPPPLPLERLAVKTLADKVVVGET